MTRILHVVPSLDVGGVEVGLLRSQSELCKVVVFRVFSVKGPGRLNVPSLNLLDLLKLMFKKEACPQVVVSSLWLGHLVGATLALIYGARWIPFFHAARSDGVWRDAILHSAARMSRFAFFDSPATHRYYKTHGEGDSQIIPYRFASPLQEADWLKGRSYTCIFVGRLSPQKRPDLLVEYLRHLQRLMPDARPLVVASGEAKAQNDFIALLKSREVVADVRANVPPLEVVELL
ncbi:hypothetical protein EBZ37_15455, partial [bacterium]|nr:hypothetical protein [bacterium]